jgi:hypothetical protein
MLLAVKNEIAKPLSLLFNRSIQEMVFPDQWKIAHVIALFKKGDKSLPSNYRPGNYIYNILFTNFNIRENIQAFTIKIR